MTDTADLNLVLATIVPGDALGARARAHLREHGPLVLPFSVGLEMLMVAKRHGAGFVDILGAAELSFELEGRDVLYTAAEALEAGEITTVFDAAHVADAMHRRGRLHTADEELLRSSFPTTAF